MRSQKKNSKHFAQKESRIMLQQDIINQVDQGWVNFWKLRNIEIKDNAALIRSKSECHTTFRADLDAKEVVERAVESKKHWARLAEAQRSAAFMN